MRIWSGSDLDETTFMDLMYEARRRTLKANVTKRSAMTDQLTRPDACPTGLLYCRISSTASWMRHRTPNTLLLVWRDRGIDAYRRGIADTSAVLMKARVAVPCIAHAGRPMRVR